MCAHLSSSQVRAAERVCERDRRMAKNELNRKKTVSTRHQWKFIVVSQVESESVAKGRCVLFGSV